MSTFIQAYTSLSRSSSSALKEAIRDSSQLFAPLEDPFRLSIGRNRWLDPNRTHEVSYSDWLAWLIEQLDDPIATLRLFNLYGTPFAKSVGKRASISAVKREKAIDNGARLLDIVVNYSKRVRTPD